MCEHSTCLPTPEEASKLISRGYGARMATYAFSPDRERYRFVGPSIVGCEGGRLLSSTKGGACTFRRDDGRCELHDLNLKPMEGRLAHHSRDWLPVRMEVVARWGRGDFQRLSAEMGAH
jgi:hypothetical protein